MLAFDPYKHHRPLNDTQQATHRIYACSALRRSPLSTVTGHDLSSHRNLPYMSSSAHLNLSAAMSQSRLSVCARVRGRGSKRAHTAFHHRLADQVDGGRAATQAAAIRYGRWWIGSPTLQLSCVLSTSHATRGPSRHRSRGLHTTPCCKPLHCGMHRHQIQLATTCPVVDIHCQ